MTEWLTTEDQMIWLKWKGRALCSSRNPRREAQQWCSSLPKIRDFQTIDIVGLGAGYHLFELHQIYPKLNVQVWDTKALIIEEYPEPLRSEFVKMQDRFHFQIGDKVSEEALTRIPEGPVFKFRPACQSEDDFLYESLLAHHPLHFLAEARQLGYELEESLKSHNEALAVQIKTINIEALDASRPETKILKVLREMVQ